MIVYLWIAFGSALGGVARYACQDWATRHISETFPWGTMIVNIIGCSIIGFFATFTGPDGRVIVGPPMRQFVMVGILGGYTTFSSFSLDALNRARDGQWAQAAGYVLGSLVFCLLGVWLGHIAAVATNGR
ncbi:MAG: fluoride efflux transporter CrcB [Acidobacteriia bacterium]|nr:fluoride efflux transporter CrcB [Terriglobia bacterium]